MLEQFLYLAIPVSSGVMGFLGGRALLRDQLSIRMDQLRSSMFQEQGFYITDYTRGYNKAVHELQEYMETLK